MRLLLIVAVCCFLGVAVSGCRTLPPLPEADLKQPGWVVREGQAVWLQKRGGTEIAGDLLVATRSGGDAFVQFTKNPFPMVTARTSGTQWQIESPLQNRRYTGRGHPPARIIWLVLPQLLADAPPPADWSWKHFDQMKWRLSNQSTGETLEGYFNE